MNFFFRIETDKIYKPRIEKLIIMIIDSWRWDFVSGSNINDMPKIKQLINNEKACIYKTKVEMPTVTMPKIKVNLLK